MGGADSRYLRKNLIKTMEMLHKAEESNDILFEDLKRCGEANNSMLKVLRSMKEYLEKEAVVEGAVRNRRNEESDELWDKINAIDIKIPDSLVRPDRKLPLPSSNDEVIIIWGIVGGIMILFSILFALVCLKKLR